MMYLINLTLTAQDADAYTPLIDGIKALGSWSNRLQNTFLLECPLNSVQIRDILKPHLKAGDRLFVAEIGRNWAGTGMGEGFKEWMDRRNVRPNVTLAPAPAAPPADPS